jgi:hypothetical protein
MNAMSLPPARPGPSGVPASRPAGVDRWPESDWERVLDCGAPGPAKAGPALFYQAAERGPQGQRPGEPNA